MVRANRLVQGDLSSVVALCAAWIGIWGAWIPHQAASLTQNAIYLANWADVLTDVRYGPLTGKPDILRLAVALAVVALAVALGAVRNLWAQWGIRLIAALPGLVLLPPYPFVLDLRSFGLYRMRFLIVAALAAGIAACLLTDMLTAQIRRGLVIVLSAVSAGLGAWAFLLLRRPFEAHYASPLAPGWGVLAFLAGLGLAALLEFAVSICHTRQRSALTE